MAKTLTQIVKQEIIEQAIEEGNTILDFYAPGKTLSEMRKAGLEVKDNQELRVLATMYDNREFHLILIDGKSPSERYFGFWEVGKKPVPNYNFMRATYQWRGYRQLILSSNQAETN